MDIVFTLSILALLFSLGLAVALDAKSPEEKSFDPKHFDKEQAKKMEKILNRID